MDATHGGAIRVVKLLDKRKVVINKGSDQGVTIGQKFVTCESDDEVNNPAAGESLGKLEIFRARAAVIHAQERMAILKVEERPKERARPLSEIMATLSGKEVESDALDEIRVGDLARPET